MNFASKSASGLLIGAVMAAGLIIAPAANAVPSASIHATAVAVAAKPKPVTESSARSAAQVSATNAAKSAKSAQSSANAAAKVVNLYKNTGTSAKDKQRLMREWQAYVPHRPAKYIKQDVETMLNLVAGIRKDSQSAATSAKLAVAESKKAATFAANAKKSKTKSVVIANATNAKKAETAASNYAKAAKKAADHAEYLNRVFYRDWVDVD